MLIIYLIGWGIYLGLSVFALNQYIIIVKLIFYTLSLAAAFTDGYIIARLLHKHSLDKYSSIFVTGHLAFTTGFISIISVPILSVRGNIIDDVKWLLEGGMADYDLPFILVLLGFYLFQISYHLIAVITFSVFFKKTLKNSLNNQSNI